MQALQSRSLQPVQRAPPKARAVDCCLCSFALLLLTGAMVWGTLIYMCLPAYLHSPDYVEHQHDDKQIRVKCGCNTSKIAVSSMSKLQEEIPYLGALIRESSDGVQLQCTVAILSRNYVIGGIKCMKNVRICVDANCLVDENRLEGLKLRTNSPYYSTGGRLSHLKDVRSSSDGSIFVFEVDGTLQFDASCRPIVYPMTHDAMNQYTLIGWEEELALPSQIFFVTKKCKNENSIRMSNAGNVTLRTTKILVSGCGELAGLYNEERKQIISTQTNWVQNWILGFLGKKPYNCCQESIDLYKADAGCQEEPFDCHGRDNDTSRTATSATKRAPKLTATTPTYLADKITLSLPDDNIFNFGNSLKKGEDDRSYQFPSTDHENIAHTHLHKTESEGLDHSLTLSEEFMEHEFSVPKMLPTIPRGSFIYFGKALNKKKSTGTPAVRSTDKDLYDMIYDV